MLSSGEKNALRLGDIISGVSFPLCRMGSSPRFLGTYRSGTNEGIVLDGVVEQIGRSYFLLGHIHSAIGLCAVLSQDCDVDPKQSPPPPAFVLCRMMLVPDGMRRQSSYEALKENVDPYGSWRPYFSLFYIGDHELLGGEYMADYSQVMTVVWKDYDSILKKKENLGNGRLNQSKVPCKGRRLFWSAE